MFHLASIIDLTFLGAKWLFLLEKTIKVKLVWEAVFKVKLILNFN